MNSQLLLKLTLLVTIISLLLFYQYGRSIWHPYYLKVKGKRTLQDVYTDTGSKLEPSLQSKFAEANVIYPPEHLNIIGLKEERRLEVWAQARNGKHTLVEQYPFTGFSGELGPKLQSGDGQIPEGLYKLEYLNPNSSYHLSMKINYPNAFDRKSAEHDGRTNLGGDIFIHGKSVTIGCIPIGDDNIEELFTLVYRVGMNNVDIIIAPYDMRIKNKALSNKNLDWLDEKYHRIEAALQNFHGQI